MSTRRSRDLNTAAPDPGIPVAREALARLEAEINRLTSCLAAVQAEAQTRDVLGDHDAPTLLAAGKVAAYVLVAPGFVDLASAKPLVSRVSNESSLGAALLSRRAVQEVEVAAPDAVRRVRLVCVE
jgi:transcription elongation GreA/GreB family factor